MLGIVIVIADAGLACVAAFAGAALCAFLGQAFGLIAPMIGLTSAQMPRATQFSRFCYRG